MPPPLLHLLQCLFLFCQPGVVSGLTLPQSSVKVFNVIPNKKMVRDTLALWAFSHLRLDPSGWGLKKRFFRLRQGEREREKTFARGRWTKDFALFIKLWFGPIKNKCLFKTALLWARPCCLGSFQLRCPVGCRMARDQRLSPAPSDLSHSNQMPVR